jgi:hypothetical protein
MKKIVELLINHDLLEDDNLTGVDTVSLVDNPAIGYEWFAFNAEYNLPAYTEEDREEINDMLMSYFNEVGEEYDPTNSTFVQSEKFAANDVTIADVTDAISALGLLKGKRDAEEVSKIVYRYEGPNDSRTRKFCKSLLNLSQRKVFTEDEINELPRRSSIVRDGVIPKAGTDASGYDLFKYAAGANCRHSNRRRDNTW